MAQIFTDHWVKKKEVTYANWFRSVYLVRRWERWHVNASGHPGLLPSQQGIEAHHGAIKKACVPSSRASTSGVLSGILPRILKYDESTLCPEKVTQYGEGPVPPEMIAKAQRLIHSSNHLLVKHGRGRNKKIVSIVFNTSEHLGYGFRRTPVDDHRATRFNESLIGHVPDGISSAEIPFELLSLHSVKLSGRSPRRAFDFAPIWPGETIEQIRGFLHYTCIACVKSGWVCSHVLASLALLKLLNLDVAMTRVNAQRPPGLPASKRRALERDDDFEGYFSTPKLRKMILKQYGKPMLWKVMDDFEVDVNDSAVHVGIVGTVTGIYMGDEDGYWHYLVSYDAQGFRNYTLDELIPLIQHAHRAGVQVVS